MNWNDVMGLISTMALLLPILILFVTRLAGYRIFPVLVIYYAIAVIYNLLTLGYIPADKTFVRAFYMANNLSDAPLILTFLTYFATTPLLKKRMKILIGAFLLFEIIVVSIYGFSDQTITITMGPGILAVLVFSLPFFVRQIKITIVHHKATGKALMIAALLFAYGCYSIIYIMAYLVKLHDRENTFLVFFFVTTFSSALMSAGLLSERKRVKKLSELKIVRKELSELYSEEKTASPLRPAVFDFDKEQWN